ncbi:glycosyltransferase family 4 protein [Candidatus Methylopumilus turicensis]|uniref:Putative Glycosyl transferase group 1 n=1 Tax=Candidatus Methylopumilus turicensis TaxID=1581680 RepID=A0A0B7IUL0_9PROT|nr:glycosyltransferase family 1 protein [Candidatus Methylopumilus turicensis]CEN55995.1 putative Glycosyl transferase group 1 [Candidatus Methylopumilus turicensis]
MKVAFDSQIFIGQVYGGISRYICEVASRISKKSQVEVKIVAPMHVNAYLNNLPKNILSCFHSPFSFNFLRLQQRAASMVLGDLMLRFMRPDIIHETYYFKYPLGSISASRVLTIHDMIHEKFESQFPYGDKTSKHKAAAAARADHIICVSESTKVDVINILGINPEKITVIHLGFDLMISPDSFVRHYGRDYLLYVGKRGGYKNFLTMLEAYATSEILRSKYDLVCFGGGAFNDDELKAIHTLNLNPKNVIQMSGDDRYLANYYKNASAFVFPSLYEGFGIPPLEAMSYGCPVVCSNTSSIPEVVGDAGEYFDPYDKKDMQKAMEMVIKSSDLRNSLVTKGFLRLKEFSWEKCASATLNVYKSLI